MKVLVCGSRTINDPAAVSRAVEQSGIRPTQIISGGARGVDRLASEYAAAKGIEFIEYLADWDKYGKRADFVRNYAMVGAADAVIAVWAGQVPTQSMRSNWPALAGSQYLFIHPTARKQNSLHQLNLTDEPRL
ncbi:MAG: DUF2493 domain-containing protein [Pyrinomonadaceae bacterium]